MKHTARMTTAARLGRWLGGVWGGCPRAERRTHRWLMAQGQLRQCMGIGAWINACKGTAPKKQPNPFFVHKLCQRAPGQSQNIGVPPVWMDAKAAQLHHRALSQGQAAQIVAGAGIAAQQRRAIAQKAQPTTADQLACLCLLYQKMQAGGVKRIRVPLGEPKAKRPQILRARQILARSGRDQAQPVAPARQQLTPLWGWQGGRQGIFGL